MANMAILRHLAGRGKRLLLLVCMLLALFGFIHFLHRKADTYDLQSNINNTKMASQYHYKVEQLSAEELKGIRSFHPDKTTHYIRINGYLLPEKFLEFSVDNVINVPLRNNDVFVVSFPRSGTTWTQELVWLVANNLDFDTAKAIPLYSRFPYLEYKLDCPLTSTAKLLAKVPEGEPRFIKSHLPLSLLPKGAVDTSKLVYVARDTRDAAVSLYYLLGDNKRIIDCDFKTFYYQVFSKDLWICAPLFKHLKEAWAQRNHPNVLFIFYEELSKDLKGTAKRVSEFLGKEYTEEQYNSLCDHLRLENLKKNKAVNNPNLVNLVRKGVAGGWRNYFDAEMAAHAQRWMEDNLRDTALRFPDIV